MSRCPKCDKSIPFRLLIFCSKKNPIECPNCQAKHLYYSSDVEYKIIGLGIGITALIIFLQRVILPISLFESALIIIIAWIAIIRIWFHLFNPKLEIDE